MDDEKFLIFSCQNPKLCCHCHILCRALLYEQLLRASAKLVIELLRVGNDSVVEVKLLWSVLPSGYAGRKDSCTLGHRSSVQFE